PPACGHVTSTRTRRREIPVLLVYCQATSLLPPVERPSPRTHTKVTLRVSVNVTALAWADITLGVKPPLPELALGSQGDRLDDLTVKKAWPLALVVSLPALSVLTISVPPRDELILTS